MPSWPEFPNLPDVIWSSTAARALQTATILTEYLDYNLNKLQVKRGLYTFDSRDLLQIVHSIPDEVQSCMMVSHNHGLTELVNQLGSTHFSNVPTTGVVIIEFEIENWNEISKGTTIFNLFPKNL